MKSPRSRLQHIWFLGRACFLVHRWLFSHYVHWGLFYKSTNPIHEGFTLWPNHLFKVPPPAIITLGIKFQHMNLEGSGERGTQTFRSSRLSDNYSSLFSLPSPPLTSPHLQRGGQDRQLLVTWCIHHFHLPTPYIHWVELLLWSYSQTIDH